jgi:hypothetical protein
MRRKLKGKRERRLNVCLQGRLQVLETARLAVLVMMVTLVDLNRIVIRRASNYGKEYSSNSYQTLLRR